MSDAIISTCGAYRYTLHRRVSCALRWIKPCLFVMLNPSVADASVDDPTIRRCIGFAKREGCTSLTVVNLFAYRATDPRDLVGEYQMGTDISGPENVGHVHRELRRHNPNLGHVIVAAWGAHPYAELAQEIRAKVRNSGALCLGMTKGGEPRHPLYVKGDAPLVPWTGTP